MRSGHENEIKFLHKIILNGHTTNLHFATDLIIFCDRLCPNRSYNMIYLYVLNHVEYQFVEKSATIRSDQYPGKSDLGKATVLL